MCANKKYTIEEKMRGEDLHGLPCRVPKPTSQQKKCSHTRKVWVDDIEEDYYEGTVVDNSGYREESACVDIPGTNNFRCTQCGYTRRY